MKRPTPAAVSGLMFVVVGLLVTAYFAKLLLADESRAPVDAAQVRPCRSIPMVLASLEAGVEVTPAHLGTCLVRAEAVEPDMILEERNALGRIVKTRIPAGAPIRASQLLQPGERPTVSVAPGMRALSVSLTPETPVVDGLLKPDRHVDVYLTPRIEDSERARLGGGLTLTLFRGVRVLAVRGRSASQPAETVTLELSPEQANVLVLARQKGEVALGFNPDGSGAAEGIAVKSRDRATLDEILGLDAAQRTAVSSPSFTVESYKGSARSVLQFPQRTRDDES